jgi:small subunit ribosomal protein S5
LRRSTERIDPETLELEERVVKTNKVQKTHKGGRTMSWSALVVVGDRAGTVGCGLGKAHGIPEAIRKGIEDAKKGLIRVPLFGATLPHEMVSEYGGAKVMLRPASPGTGVVAGGSMRTILELAGVRDVLAKSLGSPNAINTARATMVALRSLKDVHEVARMRGTEPEVLIPWLTRVEPQEQPEPEEPAAADDAGDAREKAPPAAEPKRSTQKRGRQRP